MLSLITEDCKHGYEFHILKSFYNTKKYVITYVCAYTDTIIKQIVAEYLMNLILVTFKIYRLHQAL